MKTEFPENRNHLKDRRVLVTGAAGYLGSWMAELARRSGAQVRILLRNPSPHLKEWSSQFEVALGDLNLPTTLIAACRDQEIVWHAASANETFCVTQFEEALHTNVLGTTHMLEAATQGGVKLFVKFSTFHVYGYKGKEPITEETPVFPLSAYGLMNLMGDQLGQFYRQQKGLKVILARISNGYGAPLFPEVKRWTLVVNELCKMAFEKKEIRLKGSGVSQRDFVSIQDIFCALSLISTQPIDYDVFHIGGNLSRSVLEVARLVQQVYQGRYSIKIPLIAGPKQPDDNDREVWYDISRLEKLGYRAQDRMEQEINQIFSLLERSR